METLNNGVYKSSDLSLVTSIDVLKYEIKKYEILDAGESFTFDLGNSDRMKYFTWSMYGQDGNTVTDIWNYSYIYDNLRLCSKTIPRNCFIVNIASSPVVYSSWTFSESNLKHGFVTIISTTLYNSNFKKNNN